MSQHLAAFGDQRRGSQHRPHCCRSSPSGWALRGAAPSLGGSRLLPAGRRGPRVQPGGPRVGPSSPCRPHRTASSGKGSGLSHAALVPELQAREGSWGPPKHTELHTEVPRSPHPSMASSEASAPRLAALSDRRDFLRRTDALLLPGCKPGVYERTPRAGPGWAAGPSGLRVESQLDAPLGLKASGGPEARPVATSSVTKGLPKVG